MFEVFTAVRNSDPEYLADFTSLDEAVQEFNSQVVSLRSEIINAIKSNDQHLLSYASDRQVMLMETHEILDEDGEIEDITSATLKAYGTASDWNALREEA